MPPVRRVIPVDKVLVAMSGGVDSSVAAYKLHERYACIGVTMKLFANENIGLDRRKSCCSLEDTEDARGVAYRLGMPYYVFNFADDFGSRVIDRFVCAYACGKTPNPCIDCNRFLKFDRLYRRAKELGCCAVATGHYARIAHENGRYLLKKAADATKDQSYVLYFLSQEQLAHTLFPLGDLHKAQVRELAEKAGFENAHKPDSQDICFVPDGDYAAFIERRTGQQYPHGAFTDKNGIVLGEHSGIIHYTVGQRRGLGISAGVPLYVKEILPAENRVVLGKAEELRVTALDATDFCWSAFDTPPQSLRAMVQTHYRQKETPVTVTTDGDRVHMVFDEPPRSVTAGQAAVLYDGDVVLGGGTISTVYTEG